MWNLSFTNCVLIYIVLSIIYVLLRITKYEKYIEYENLLKSGEIEQNTLKYYLINNYLEFLNEILINNSVTVLYLKNYRNHLSILGLVIDYINYCLTVVEKEDLLIA